MNPLPTHIPKPTLIACIVMVRNHRVYLAKRDTDDNLSGKWELPAGKVEFGEHPRDTAKRELSEECGVFSTASSFELLPTIVSNVFDDPLRHFVLLCFKLRVGATVEPKIRPGIHSEGGWFEFCQILDLVAKDLVLPKCDEISSTALYQ